MDREFIIPSNSKKQCLVFGFMQWTDVIILGIGVAITFILFMIFPITTLPIAIICLLPILISAFLVFPIPNYHNTRCLIYIVFRYYIKDIKKYYWRGWCYQYEQPSEQPNKQ